jgi:hypothetical protein
MQVVQIEEREGKIRVRSPYHPAFVARARDLHGKWDSPCWVFDARDREHVEDSLRHVYGYADSGRAGELVTCRVHLDRFEHHHEQSYYLLGRLLVKRPSRDSRIDLGPDVIAVEGGFPSSGGSVKNPRCQWREGTVLELKDVPRVLYDRLEPTWKDAVELVGSPDAPADPKSLAIAEIRRLMAEHGITAADLAAEGGAR